MVIIVVVQRLLALLLFIVVPVSAQTGLPAFPGAEGFGSTTIGGRGGDVLFVTSLADSGPGTLREALENPNPRIVIFKVGGIIALDTTIFIRDPFVTIAGQTAPGDGICIRGGLIDIETHDVIIRNLRFRIGDILNGLEPAGHDALRISNFAEEPYNIIIDHCSIGWAIDENFSTWFANHDITLQWSIIGEGLDDNVHPNGPHSMGAQIGHPSVSTSLHHNLFIHNNDRNPRLSNETRAEIINNVVYNWGARGSNIGYEDTLSFTQASIIGNHFIQGPNTPPWQQGIYVNTGVGNQVYVQDNLTIDRPGNSGNEWLAVDGDTNAVHRVFSPPNPLSNVTVDDVLSIRDIVLANAGAIVPARDAVDNRLVRDVIDSTGSIINSQQDVGGWPVYSNGSYPPDNDNDGMPNSWEQSAGLNQNDPSDVNGDIDGNGYTNIEDYINSVITIQATIPDAGPNQFICEATDIQLAANTPLVGNGEWRVISGPATLSSTTDPNATASGLGYGDNQFEWKIGGNGYPVIRDTVVVSNYEFHISDAGVDQEVCGTTVATLSGNSPSPGTGMWNTTHGSAVVNDPTNPLSTVSGLDDGINEFEWVVTNGECVSKDTVWIILLDPPSQADAGPDQELCADTITIMNAAQVPSGTGSWTILFGPATLDDPTDRRTIVRNLGIGSNRFEWQISSGDCPPTRDTVEVFVYEEVIADAGPNQEICGSGTFFEAVLPPGASGTWTLLNGSGNVVNPFDPTSRVNNLGDGLNRFRWTVTHDVCPTTFADVEIIVSDDIPQPNAGPDQEICGTNQTLLEADPIAVGTGTWQLVSGSGVIADPNNPRTAVTGLSLGANEFSWVVTNGNCNPAADNVVVTLEGDPALDFEYVINDLTVDFNSLVTDGIQFKWRFGDGQIGFGNPARHTYNNYSTYGVVMFVRHDCGKFSYSQNITLTPPLNGSAHNASLAPTWMLAEFNKPQIFAFAESGEIHYSAEGSKSASLLVLPTFGAHTISQKSAKPSAIYENTSQTSKIPGELPNSSEKIADQNIAVMFYTATALNQAGSIDAIRETGEALLSGNRHDLKSGHSISAILEVEVNGDTVRLAGPPPVTARMGADISNEIKIAPIEANIALLLADFAAPSDEKASIDKIAKTPEAESQEISEIADGEVGSKSGNVAEDDAQKTEEPVPGDEQIPEVSHNDVAPVKMEHLPTDFALGQNFPNPFNPSTTIEFATPESAPVKLVVYNLLGQQIRTLINSTTPAGNHQVNWDGKDDGGKMVPSGVYIYRMTARTFIQTRKMMYLQ